MTTIVDPDIIEYFNNNSIEKRKALSKGIFQKYSDKIPVVVIRGDIKRTPQIVKRKYLAPRDVTLGKFCVELRKNMPSLNPYSSLFFFVNNTSLAPNSMLMGAIYDNYKNEDGFLYLTYTCENTFG